MLLLCVVIAAMLSSCRTVKEVQYERVHDTVTVVEKEYIHDTLQTTQTVHDSVDRYVEKVVYTDANGVVHEREIERLTRIIRESNEEYRVKESEYLKTIEELREKLAEKVTTVEVKKPLNWFEKTMIGLGVCFIILVVGYCIKLFYKFKTKL